MQNMTEELKQLLERAVESIAKEAGQELPEGFMVRLERPRQAGHGDWATNIAMQLAKPFGIKPRELADKLVNNVPLGEIVEKAEVAGPGFINFTLASNWITETVKSTITQNENYGRVNSGKGRRIQNNQIVLVSHSV